MLYTNIHTGSLPSPLPNRIRLSNGTTRTDVSTFTPEEIADAGYLEVEDPPNVAYPNKVVWTGTMWAIEEPSDLDIEMQWNSIRQYRNTLLAQSDVEVLKCYELGVPVPTNIVQYRQALRDLPQVQTDPYAIQWPAPDLDDEVI